MNYQTIKDLLNNAICNLETANIDDAKQNVNLIASKVLNIEYTKLPLYWNNSVSDDFYKNFHAMLERRLKHEPLQYILGEWCFLDFDINVGKGALIPRPETEEVFLAAVEAIKANSIKPDFIFADVGTGTGILGLAMAKYFQKSIGFLLDISDEALEIAYSNLLKYSELFVQSNNENRGCTDFHCEQQVTRHCEKNEVFRGKWQSSNLYTLNNSRLNLVKSDLLEEFQANSLDVIISNPPYIDSQEVLELMPEVVDYEPHLALDGGKDGLEIINKLQSQALEVLKNNGFLIFEHGHGQRNEINKLLSPCWKIIKEGNDFADKERYFVLQLCKEKQ